MQQTPVVARQRPTRHRCARPPHAPSRLPGPPSSIMASAMAGSLGNSARRKVVRSPRQTTPRRLPRSQSAPLPPAKWPRLTGRHSVESVIARTARLMNSSTNPSRQPPKQPPIGTPASQAGRLSQARVGASRLSVSADVPAISIDDLVHGHHLTPAGDADAANRAGPCRKNAEAGFTCANRYSKSSLMKRDLDRRRDRSMSSAAANRLRLRSGMLGPSRF